MNVNYDLLFQEAKSKAKEGSKLLLHVCCAPAPPTVDTFAGRIRHYAVLFRRQHFPRRRMGKTPRRSEKLVDIVNNGQFEQKAKFPLKLHVKQYNYGNFLHCAKGLEKEREGAQGAKSALNCALTTLATLPTPTNSTTLPPLSPFPPTKTAKLSTPLEADLQKSAVALHRLQKAQRLQRKRASVAKIQLVPPALLRMRLRPSTNATGAKTKD